MNRHHLSWALLCVLSFQSASAQTGPKLDIQPAGKTQVQITWPPDQNLNVLQERPGLGGTNVWGEVPQAPAVVGQNYQVLRDRSNAAAFYRLSSRGILGQSTPPDPASNAPPPVPNTFNDLGSSTAFLYTGSNAVQIGVAPGTIAPDRAAVLRGKVKKHDNSPLAGVRVAILSHPEYGYTFSRQDGLFDLAVNGGPYTVDYQAIGYCPAQRQAEAPLQDYRTLKDVVMVPLDPVATPVSFSSNAPPQLASGSPQTDASGLRTTKAFFPAGTTASLLMSDGSTLTASGLTLRITEVTVGANGPAAMPALLPANSAYTFCADFAADEALSLGARSIHFNQPVWSYVDNFLGIPVGMLVPSGYYDRELAAWVPQENGLVIKVLDVTGGLAQVDLTGSGVAADSGTLATNQFTTAELQKLASTYGPGTTLWRMPMTHFSFVDFNYAVWPTNQTKPPTPPARPITSDCDTCGPLFGAVNFTSQVFEEAIPLVGVPMALHYSSARVPDYRELARAVVPLLPTNLPTGILGVEVRSEIGGVVKDVSYPLTPGSSAVISWDGYDAYGRFVGGSRDANIEVDYYYPLTYAVTPAGGTTLPLFGGFGQTNSGVGRAGSTAMTSSTFKRTLTIPDHRGLGLGGWSLTPHHRYDPVQRSLYLGDGTVLQPELLGNGVQGVLDQSSVPNLLQPGLVNAGPDGTLFFLSFFTDGQRRLFKRSPAGQYTFLSGDGYQPGVIDLRTDLAAADGQSALKSNSGGYVDMMKAGPDGSLYFRSAYLGILRIDPQGVLHVVLGYGPNAYPPDGTPARAAYCVAHLDSGSLGIAPDGTVYYDDRWNFNGQPFYFIRKVAPDERIYTVSGQAGPLLGGDWHPQMGQPARSMPLNPVADLTAGPDGSLYVASTSLYPYVGGIFKITPGGLTQMVMRAVPLTYLGWEYRNLGQDPPWTGDDGKVAATFTNTFLPGESVKGLQVTSDGSVLFQEKWNLIWRITPDGILQRLAGRGPSDAQTAPLKPIAGGNPLNTLFASIGTFSLSPDKTLSLIDASVAGILQITTALSGFTGQELQIPAQDASEVYVFDPQGNHLRTLNGLTGTTNWSFFYDASNLVTDLRDANGLLTHLERNGAGQPTAIVGPYGQRTTLALDGNGFLSAVVNPVGEGTVLTHTAGGLLTSITRPLGDSDTVAYDPLGLVSQIRDPMGGGYDISRSDTGDQIIISSATTIFNVDTRLLTLQPSGDTLTAANYPDGTSASTTLFQSGLESTRYSDGTLENSATAGDPRFPQATRLTASASVQLPGGPVNTLTVSRSAALSNTSNPFSVATLTNVATLNGQVWRTSYNGTNRVWVATSPEGRQATTGVDGQGRAIHLQTADQIPMDISYDAQGRLSEFDETASAGLRRTTFAYDSLGRLRTVSDPLGRTNQYSYDGAGRLQQIGLPDGQVVNIQCDAELNLVSATPPGRPAHRFDYNTVGLTTNYTPPLVNGIDESVQYAYDADRKLTRVALPDGQNTLVTRGPGGRIDQLVLGLGPTFTYAYASNNGLPINIVSTIGDSLHFDYEGPFITNTTWSGSITGRVSRTINANFLPASQSVNGAGVAYVYDRDLLLTQAGSLSVTRDATVGLITGTSLGSVTDLRQFNRDGQLTNYVASVNGTPLWSVAFRFDLLGRLTDKVETVGSTTRTVGYVYDAAGRLQQVWQNGILATTYTYDANGNRLSRNVETATYDSQDRVQTYAGSRFNWTRNGTLQSRSSGGQVTTYTYDVRGSLTRVDLPGGPVIEYLNDVAGRRIGKKVGAALQRGWLWDNDRPVAQLDGGSSLALRFVYGGNGRTPSYLIAGTNSYRVLSDERGSVRLVVNTADGSIAQELDYDEFGRVLGDTNPGFQPFGYAGGLYDADTGLVRFGARDYDAATGRWTGRDPSLLEGGSLNFYAYVFNDPINWVDLDGTQPSLPPMMFREPNVIVLPGGAYLLAHGIIQFQGEGQIALGANSTAGVFYSGPGNTIPFSFRSTHADISLPGQNQAGDSMSGPLIGNHSFRVEKTKCGKLRFLLISPKGTVLRELQQHRISDYQFQRVR
jgi:RHS repeat-associated protein